MLKNEVIRIQSKDNEMHDLYLKGPDSEGYNDFVYAGKNNPLKQKKKETSFKKSSIN